MNLNAPNNILLSIVEKYCEITQQYSSIFFKSNEFFLILFNFVYSIFNFVVNNNNDSAEEDIQNRHNHFMLHKFELIL